MPCIGFMHGMHRTGRRGGAPGVVTLDFAC